MKAANLIQAAIPDIEVLDAQEKKLLAYCQDVADDVEVYDIYRDDGYSGRNTNRPGYRKMMEDIDEWDILVVLKMDRIHRNSRNFMAIMDRLNRNGKMFVSSTESLAREAPRSPSGSRCSPSCRRSLAPWRGSCWARAARSRSCATP